MTDRAWNSARWRTRLQLYGGIALGVGLLGWFLWSIDLPALLLVLSRVQWRWIAAACGLALFHYAIHGYRWKLLLHHVDPDLDWRTLWRASTILWGFNTLLPLRAGNLLRPAVVSLERDLPYTTLLFTLVAETLCDVFAIVGLSLLTLRLLPASVSGSETLDDLRSWGTWLGSFALLGLVVVVMLSTRRARALVEALVAPMPSNRARELVLRVFDQLVEGMLAVGEPLRLVQALAVTVAVWGAWLLSLAATLRAFELSVPVAGVMFTEAALTVAMMVPQAPGFLGMFQVVTEQSLGLFGVPDTEGKAVGLVFWAVCFGPVTLLGLWDGYRLGMGFGPGAKQAAIGKLSAKLDSNNGE